MSLGVLLTKKHGVEPSAGGLVHFGGSSTAILVSYSQHFRCLFCALYINPPQIYNMQRNNTGMATSVLFHMSWINIRNKYFCYMKVKYKFKKKGLIFFTFQLKLKQPKKLSRCNLTEFMPKKLILFRCNGKLVYEI